MSAEEATPVEALRTCEWSGCRNKAAWWAKTPWFKMAICTHCKDTGDVKSLAAMNYCSTEQKEKLTEIKRETGKPEVEVEFVPIFK
jgi:hypothetical protein